MLMLKQISRLRFIAVAACLSAVVVYSSFAPQAAYACEEEGCCVCYSGGVSYSAGDCLNKKECVCNTQPSCSCSWIASAGCEPLND